MATPTSYRPSPDGRPRPPRRNRLAFWRWVGVGGVLAVVLVVAFLAYSGNSGLPGIGITSASTDENETVQTRQIDIASEDDIADDAIHDLDTLREQFGEPGYANMGRLRIPLIGLDSPLSLMLVGEDGVMPTPQSPIEVAWYDFSSMPGYGGRPGEPGSNTVLAAHVDKLGWVDYAGVEYSGPAAFWSIDLLAPGDEIEVEFGGAVYRYAVSWSRQMDAFGPAWSEVLSANGEDVITLITCSGSFDGAYSHRLVVRATRIA